MSLTSKKGQKVQKGSPSSSSSVSSSESSSSSQKKSHQKQDYPKAQAQIQPHTQRTPFKHSNNSENPSNMAKLDPQSINDIDTPKKNYKHYEQISISTKHVPNSGKMISSLQIIAKNQIPSYQKVDISNMESNNAIVSNRQISHTIDFLGTFQNVKKAFSEHACKNKMKIMRQTNNVIIMKTQPSYSYKCLLSICLPFSIQSSVYQLKNYPTRKIKPKLFQQMEQIKPLNQEQQQFEKFRKDLCCMLLNSKVIEVNQTDAVELFFHTNRLNFDFIAEQCQNVLNKKSKQNFEHAKSVLKVLKDSQANLKRRMHKFQGINSNPSSQKKLQQFIFSSVKIGDVFTKIFEQGSTTIEIRKNSIFNNYTLSQLFDQLEIQQKLRLTDQQYPLSLSLTPDRSKLPYFSAIQMLEAMKICNCPSSNIQLAAVFNYRMRNACNESRNMVKMVQLDMDSILPLTIYCVIICQNREILAIAKMMLQYLQHQDNCECEKKVFTSIEASLEFLMKEWNAIQSKNLKSSNNHGVIVVK